MVKVVNRIFVFLQKMLVLFIQNNFPGNELILLNFPMKYKQALKSSFYPDWIIHHDSPGPVTALCWRSFDTISVWNHHWFLFQSTPTIFLLHGMVLALPSLWFLHSDVFPPSSLQLTQAKMATHQPLCFHVRDPICAPRFVSIPSLHILRQLN